MEKNADKFSACFFLVVVVALFSFSSFTFFLVYYEKKIYATTLYACIMCNRYLMELRLKINAFFLAWVCRNKDLLQYSCYIY